MRLSKTIALSCGLALLAVPTAHAVAEPILVEAGQPMIKISYAGLDLGSSAGVESLRTKVRAAAKRLCTEPGVQPLSTYLARRACVKNAVEDAGGQIRLAIANFANRQYAGASEVTVVLR
jgi:UrcA family protein